MRTVPASRIHIADTPAVWHALALAFVLAAAAASSPAQQSGWRPQKPVEIVVPSAAGGAQDTLARHIQRIVQNGRIVDVPMVIVNKPGGGGNLALTHLDQRIGDGHVLFNSTMGLMTNHIVGRSKVTYTDYTPIAILFSEATTFVVRPDSPLKTGRDVMERLRADPQALSVAIGIAVGGTNHLTVALVMKAMGVDVRKLKTVVFQSNAQTVTALMGGHVDLAPMSLASALNAQEQGRLRILGVSSERRGEGALAEVPTWKEQGFNVVFANVRFLVGPKGMTPQQTAFWDGALERVVQSEDWRNEVAKNHWTPDYVGSKQSGQRMATIHAQLKDALTDVGLAKD